MMGVIKAFYRCAAERKLGLMLDLDGATLHRKPAVHNPVEPDLEYDKALRILAENGCPVSINTGRPEIFVNNVFPTLTRAENLPLWIATETGARISGPNAQEEFSKGIQNIQSLRTHFADKAQNYQGAIIEDHKMCAITISLKHCPDDQRPDAYAHMLSVANEAAQNDSGISIIPIWKPDDVYIEIVPRGVDKGSAARHILQNKAFEGMKTFCFGDSPADEIMMAVVRDQGGCAIGVGESVPAHMQDINLSDYHALKLSGHPYSR